jgi:hypothetical protein
LRVTPPLNLPAPGRRQCLYVVLRDFADTCVFAKQSLEPILCGLLPLMPAKGTQVPEAPLLPKLRGHFAEFLLHSSLEHLRLLASPTCVRLRYGHKMHSPPRLFSAAGFARLGEANLTLVSDLGYPGLLSPGTAYLLAPGQPPPGPGFTPASPLRVVTHILWCGNIRPLSIAYALRPRLRDRLTQGGRACPWNP